MFRNIIYIFLKVVEHTTKTFSVYQKLVEIFIYSVINLILNQFRIFVHNFKNKNILMMFPTDFNYVSGNAIFFLRIAENGCYLGTDNNYLDPP